MKKSLLLLLVFLLCMTFTGKSPAQEMTEPRISYDSAKVSYLGPEGTYTQEACEVFFDKQGIYIPCKTVNDAVQDLIDEKSYYAVIPQENTIGGAVTDYIDTLIAQKGVFVTGEVELSISQNLLVIPGTKLENITTVYSHKQGIAQGKEWLEKNLPDALVLEVSSTAEGARMVSEGEDPAYAAIASAGCADVYGLEILASGIQNNDKNKTRFYVLTLEEPTASSDSRLAFIASGSAKDLPALMTEISRQEMTLVTIHDRPQKTELGYYDYLIECSGGSYDKYKELIEKTPFTFRYLGSFNVR